MKKLIFIIACFMTLSAAAQTIVPDSVSKEDPIVITQYDEDMAKIYQEWMASTNRNSGDSRLWNEVKAAYDKIKLIEKRKEKKIQDSLDRISRRYQDSVNKAFNAKQLAKFTKTYGLAIAKKLLAEKIWIGMTADMMMDEFGAPEIRSVKTASGTTQTWTYPYMNFCPPEYCPLSSYYMVFKNHKLVAIGDL